MSLDLHDGPMQDLVAVGFALQRLQRDLAAIPGDTSALDVQVDAIREQLGHIEVVLRGLAAEQADHTRETLLAQLVDEEVARFAHFDDAEIILDMDQRIEPETDSQRIALHRVLREALTNVNKHAGAGHVTVRLYEQDDVIYLQVSDDGIGFDPVVARGRSDSLGLNGMYERLRLLGSDLSVDSRPGGPTTVTAAVRRWRPA